MNHSSFICCAFALIISVSLPASEPDQLSDFSWDVPETQKKMSNPIPSTAQTIERGKNLYRQHCVACHGINADGKSIAAGMLYPKPSNLREISGKSADGEIAYKIKNGRGLMPEWESILTDTQVWSLVNYIKSLSKI